MAERVAEHLVDENDPNTFMAGAEGMRGHFADLEIEEVLVPPGDLHEIAAPKNLVGVRAVETIPEVGIFVRLTLESRQRGLDVREGGLPVHEAGGELIVGVLQ